MNIDATDFPEDYLVEAGTSNCGKRNTTTGVELTVDVSANDAINLEGATYTADESNENFERYSSIDILAWIPNFNFLPENVPESYRFVFSSLLAWSTGTTIFPIIIYMITSFIVAIINRSEHGRLVKLLDEKVKLAHTCIEDYKLNDKTFLICCWPEAVVDIISNKFPDEETLKLRLLKGGKVEKVLECMGKNMLE